MREESVLERVLALEKHVAAGGLTQTFSREGFSWALGVHTSATWETGLRVRTITDGGVAESEAA
jgi:hypothetical protein